MGVKIKMNQKETVQTLVNLGVPKSNAEAVLGEGVSCTITNTSIAFSNDKGLYEKCVFQPGILTLAKKGALKKNSLEHLQHMVKTTFEKVMAKVGVESPTTIGDMLSTQFKSGGSKAEDHPEVPHNKYPDVEYEPIEGKPEKAKVFKGHAASLSMVKHPENKDQVFELMAQGPVSLTSAVTLYQPVRGTSEGSKYFLIARNHDLRVAARVLSGKLSLRFEGDIEAYDDALTSLGISKSSKEHASMHLDVGNKDMARRTIGSVLYGLNMSWSTPTPVVDFLWEQGA